jgi:DDE family transposase
VPFKFHSKGRHHIPHQRHRVTNWRDYDAALRNSGSLTIWFMEEALAGWRAQPRKTPGGRVVYSDLAIETALTLREVFRLALRQSEGLIASIMQMLAIDLPIPNYTTPGRRACGFPVHNRVRIETGDLHLIADSGEIAAFDLTDKDVDDASHVEPLLDQLADAPASFMADGAYDHFDGVGTERNFFAPSEESLRAYSLS